MATSDQQTFPFTTDESTSSPAGSPASRLVQLEKERARLMTDISGQKCLEQFGKFPRAGLWAKMFAALLIGTKEWYSTKCNLTWNLKVSKSSRFYFQLAPSMRRTEGTESGLLPTPVIMDTATSLEVGTKRGTMERMGQNTQETGWGVTLNELMLRGLLPTPSAGNDHTGGYITEWGGSKNPLRKMLPTPAARDYRSGFNPESEVIKNRENHARGVNLHEHIQREIGQNFLLNPQFTEEMMGYPIGYSELKPLETPSSPK